MKSLAYHLCIKNIHVKQMVESLVQSLDVPSTIWWYSLDAYSIMKGHQISNL
jgi:hypothetical protein